MVTRAASVDHIHSNQDHVKQNGRINNGLTSNVVTFEPNTSARTHGVRNFLEKANLVVSTEILERRQINAFSKDDVKTALEIAEIQKDLASVQFVNGIAFMGEQAVDKINKQASPMDLFSTAQMNANEVNNTKSPAKPVNFYNLYTRYMALMGRILGQAEAEAHALYKTIKQRTDAIDVLTSLISKINNTSGTIDWSKNEEMKKLVDKARELGVDIPQGKYSWKEDEKKLLKENIQTKKDAMEKMTQMERTDMQKFLQEASQMHQGRSNVLKMLKEVMDVLIRNIAP